ncbi:MAG: hypothetical protein HYZ75_00815 [Elusimicrobia bacterium]|nr:hypothetical protein [Elusimicrobiota bacterium]
MEKAKAFGMSVLKGAAMFILVVQALKLAAKGLDKMGWGDKLRGAARI